MASHPKQRALFEKGTARVQTLQMPSIILKRTCYWKKSKVWGKKRGKVFRSSSIKNLITSGGKYFYKARGKRKFIEVEIVITY